MIKISDVVLETLQRDQLALEALQAGFLNLSAYAEKIHKHIEKITLKPVKKGTIVVALSRITKGLGKTKPLLPQIVLSDISTKSSLTALTFDKTADIQRKVGILNPFLLPVGDLFSVTEGPSEVTLVFADHAKEKIEKHFASKPKAAYHDLVAITVRLKDAFVFMPNAYHALFAALAPKRIAILEVVSTHNEISFIIRREGIEDALQAFNTYLVKSGGKTKK